jgi:lipoprotein-anchoring transpeptidase ErfK/SrfK
VTIGGVHVGGLTPKAALSAVKIAFSSPLVVTVDDIRMAVSPRKLGAKAYVENAVARATAARSGQAIDLAVTVKGTAVRSWVARLAQARNREVRDASVVLQKLRPKIVEERDGLTVRREATVAVVVDALRENRRGPVGAVVRTVRAKVTADSIGSIVVIRRGAKQLRYYDGTRLVKIFTVATGQPSFPTPLGRFEIIQMSRNPWWYPPPSPWAQGLNPVPPGPGNPLGTRWMGISSPAVGIHGTPDAASLGYSASHGCIRMAIPSAEWLFEHVAVGTPVIIVPV